MKNLSLLKIYLILISFIISTSIFIDSASATPKANFTILPSKHFTSNKSYAKGVLFVLDKNDGSIWAYSIDFGLGLFSAEKIRLLKERGYSPEDIQKFKNLIKPIYIGKMIPGKLLIFNEVGEIITKRIDEIVELKQKIKKRLGK